MADVSSLVAMDHLVALGKGMMGGQVGSAAAGGRQMVCGGGSSSSSLSRETVRIPRAPMLVTSCSRAALMFARSSASPLRRWAPTVRCLAAEDKCSLGCATRTCTPETLPAGPAPPPPCPPPSSRCTPEVLPGRPRRPAAWTTRAASRLLCTAAALLCTAAALLCAAAGPLPAAASLLAAAATASWPLQIQPSGEPGSRRWAVQGSDTFEI